MSKSEVELNTTDEPALKVILPVDAVDAEIPMAYIIELYQKGLSYPEIAAVVGCSYQNVHQRLQRVKGHIDALPAIESQEVNMMKIIDHKIGSELIVRDFKKTPDRDLMVMKGISTDKKQLLEGKATANIAHVHKGITTKISDLEARIVENRALLGTMPEEDEDE